jgi:hypothetical protein
MLDSSLLGPFLLLGIVFSTKGETFLSGSLIHQHLPGSSEIQVQTFRIVEHSVCRFHRMSDTAEIPGSIKLNINIIKSMLF